MPVTSPIDTRLASASARTARVLVAGESGVLMRRIAQLDALAARHLEVCAEATGGTDLLIKVRSFAPDAVLILVGSRQAEWLDAVRTLMAKSPKPLVVCAPDAPAYAPVMEAALAAGAISCVKLGTSATDTLAALPATAEALADALCRASRIRVVRTLGRSAEHLAHDPAPAERLAAAGARPPEPAPADAAPVSRAQSWRELRPARILIAASTGGPVALRSLLRGIPKGGSLPPVLVAQHMPPGFVDNLAESLAGDCSLTVRVAAEGEMPKHNHVYIAPGDRHMELTAGGRITISDGLPLNYCRPSADKLFLAAARHHATDTLALVLTGMGEDGARGALALRRAGGFVLGQNETSSVVFGMAGVADKLGALAALLPLDDIGEHLARLSRPA